MKTKKKGNSRALKKDYFTITNVFLSGAYFLLFLKGFWSNKSLVPYWDEWDSRVNLWTNFISNGTSALFGLHNEHRPVLTFIVFSLDSWIFNGSGQFVYLINGISIFFIGYLFFQIFSTISVSKNSSMRLHIALISFLPFLSLTGHENIYWVNQNSFFLAIIFSLLPFLYLLRITGNSLNHREASTATALGILATLTMASGLLVPFVLGFIFLFAYRHVFYFFCNLTLGGITYIFYSTGISKNTGSDPVRALIDHPIFIARYTFKFLTNPFSSGTGYLKLLGVVIGFVLLIILLRNTAQVFRDPNPNSIIILSLAYYFVAIAILIGAGRIQFGLEQSMSSRYTLFSWCFLLVSTLIGVRSFDDKKRSIQKRQKLLNTLILVLILGTFQQQLKFSNSDLEIKTERAFAQQLLKLGLGDSQTQQAIYPDYARLLAVSEAYRSTKKFNFSSPLFVEKLGSRYAPSKGAFCTSYLETTRFVDSDSNFMIVSGWIAEKSAKTSEINPIQLKIYNDKDLNVGVGFVGLKRPDVSESLKTKDINYGFLAVVESRHIRDALFIGSKNCYTRLISIP